MEAPRGLGEGVKVSWGEVGGDDEDYFVGEAEEWHCWRGCSGLVYCPSTLKILSYSPLAV